MIGQDTQNETGRSITGNSLAHVSGTQFPFLEHKIANYLLKNFNLYAESDSEMSG